MTMAPARAVTLIKPHVHGQESQREAMPRWGIAAADRLSRLSRSLAPRVLAMLRRRGRRPWTRKRGGRRLRQFAGAVVERAARCSLRLGAVLGWFVAPPVNAVLNRFLAGFNWVFDRLSGGYGFAGPRLAPRVVHPAGGLRRAAGHDRPGLQGRAQGLHPRSGQGLPGRQRATPRRREPGAHGPPGDRTQQDRPGNRGRRPRDRRSRLFHAPEHQHQQRGRHVRDPWAF